MGHKVRTWTQRFKVARGLPVKGQCLMARCSCGWERSFTTKRDRRIDVGKHRDEARWLPMPSTLRTPERP